MHWNCGNNRVEKIDKNGTKHRVGMPREMSPRNLILSFNSLAMSGMIAMISGLPFLPGLGVLLCVACKALFIAFKSSCLVKIFLYNQNLPLQCYSED